MQEFRRILVVRTDRIGDVILTLPMLELLRRKFPSAHIAMLVRYYTKDLVDDNKNLDEIILYDDGETLVPFFTLTSILRRKKFDVAFVTYPRFRLASLMWWARIPLRVGTGYRWYSFLFNKRVYVHRSVAEKHEAEYNVDLIKAVGCEVKAIPYPHLEVPQGVTDNVKARLPEFRISTDKSLIILHPGSGGSARDWSPKKFGQLGARLAKLPETQIAVTGGKGEENLVRTVAQMVGVNTPVIVDQLSLLQYAALASFAELLVANSTGPLHIAAAVGTPVIGLYPQITAMSEKRWGPFTSKKAVFVPRNKPIHCNDCLRGAIKECECMNTISVDEVFEAAKLHLQSGELSETK